MSAPERIRRQSRRRDVLTLAALLPLALAGTVHAAQSQGEPTVYERARNGTTRAAKATGKALDRAADRTGDWLKQVPEKVGTAAHKTDAALERAADKVGLPRGQKNAPARSDQGGMKAGPRPTP